MRRAKVAAAIAIAVLTVLLFAAWRYRAHIAWRLEERRLELGNVRMIPVAPMPACDTPEGWTRCRVGCVEFSLPADLATHRTTEGRDKSAVVFQDGSLMVIVAVPSTTNDSARLLDAASQLSLESPCRTLPQLRVACCQASSDDFR